MSSSATQSAANRFRFLAEAAAWRYRPQGALVRRRVREKLLRDPVCRWLLASARLPAEGLLLDLGCGEGAVLALLACAQSLGRPGDGKRGPGARLLGIEADPVDFLRQQQL